MINPLRHCAFRGEIIGEMETAPGVHTTVWKCTRRNRPTCSDECYERGCAISSEDLLDKLPVILPPHVSRDPEKLRALAAHIATADLPDGSEPPPRNSYEDGP